ncbi:N-acetylated-alpha-linked acidic dipeptidase 2-like [Anneissia japonica]|uniref:N-acetylated-alpha-linked acidic dipeptidase 2-like n=1 Tax=Anneissia japonica TaxID=1529436 RepID=UPI0014254B2D|nr:N-acetylated-alpha-linked acidic dipeptidase 2-like [Anneissia japonica]XP_033119869.1 N-acetylated-alpha-linked acidic dipeptidase 2-like [Anneissia japonica]XP_033119870.1 N-acetylated-alpha-linked acidic dipeptidase 2-like [Anneissia japonica]XP_033119872.1 N-acetylated-alpha-linked acidic dipeptidase 2-like [Anneissia japonica]XP_033119873.1 N-acetylated-alpha-linked acidic dipeptidase 2-like [Anneissia japonica]XP_033119874.1 N-acetylated-alpha-linked acidic dipeptidase 2-like [Anneiss
MDTNNSTATYTRFSGEKLETGVYTLEDEVTIPNHAGRQRTRLMWCSNNRRILLALFVIFLVFCFGFIAGYLVRRSVHSSISSGNEDSSACTEANNIGEEGTTMAPPTVEAIFQNIKTKMSPRLMKDNIEKFGIKGPHLAGSDWSRNQADRIYDQWSNFGFKTTLKKYVVTLSKPGTNTLNISGSIAEELSVQYRKAYTPYSLNTSVSGEPIFVNYGRNEDYHVLTSTANYKFEAHTIALARMGKMSLGLMAKIAEEKNLKGLIVFADPTDYAPKVNYSLSMQSTIKSQVFPKTTSLPEDTVVQDTLLFSMGDPFTPGFVSGDQQAFNLSQTGLVKIPVIAIDYETAYKIFSTMQGAVPSKDQFPEWSGSFLRYPVEGTGDQNIIANISVSNKLEQTEIINVISVIKGSVEPEQYVIIGGHRDSVSVGAASPGTGVTCLLEVARLLKFLMNNRKWKPYRSIILASWDAGAQGQMGSTEWIEAHLSLLQDSVVAYINLDDAVVGDYVFDPTGSPLLSEVIYKATKNVSCPLHEDMTVYMDWKNKVDKDNTDPSFGVPGIGSDDSPFLHLIGVPTVSFSYSYNKASTKTDKYPLYNTAWDTSLLVDMYETENLDYHSAIIEVALRVLFEIADSPILPFSVVNYANVLLKEAERINNNNDIDILVSAASDFKTSAEKFNVYVNDAIQKENSELYSGINFKLMSVEKIFLSKIQRPYYKDYRHLMMGPTSQKAFNGILFPPLSDALALGDNTSESFKLEIVSSLRQASDMLSSQRP